MEDFNIRLESYKEKAEELLNRKFEDFENFKQLETQFCSLINEGSTLRRYLIEHPEICDNDTYMVLTNRVKDFEIINDKFKSLLWILNLTAKLIEHYKVQVEILLQNKSFKDAVGIYEQLFIFTRDFVYRKHIADILAKEFNDTEQALGLYKTFEQALENSYEYWDDYSKLASKKCNMNLESYCKSKKEECRLKAKVKEFLDNKQYKDAIKVDEKLFKVTNDFKYKIEIANIYAVYFEDLDKAIDLYKRVMEPLKNDAKFWWQLSELYEYKDDTYNRVACMQQAIRVELANYDKEKENN